MIIENNKFFNNLTSILIVALFFSLAYVPIASFFLGFPSRELKYGLLVLVVFIGFSFLLFSKIPVSNRHIFIILLTSAIFIISSIFWTSFYISGIYLGVILSSLIFLFKKEDLWKKMIIFTLFLTGILGLFEFFTNTSIYAIQKEVNGVLVTLDADYFSGAYSSTRIKGIFEGPLTLVQFLIFTSALFKGLNIRFLCLIIAIMTASRTGIVCCAMLVFVSVFERGKFKQSSAFLFLSLLFLFYLISTIFTASEISERIFTITDFENDLSNVLRLNQWVTAISQYLDYPIENLIFGNSGLMISIIGINAESGWLELLVSAGILGFLFYFLPTMYILMKSLSVNNFSLIISTLIIIVAASVQTLFLSSLSNILFWFFIITSHRELNKKKEHDKLTT